MGFIRELKRRNVVRVGLFYIVSSWLIIQVADVLFDAMDLPSAWMRLVLALLALGFPIALALSWIFELTPDGLKRDAEVDPLTVIPSGRRLNLATIVVVLLGVGVLFAERFYSPLSAGVASSPDQSMDSNAGSPETAISAIPVIAVLPFTASGSDDGGFLAGGLHDDLLTRLAQLKAFDVISRTSMMEYAGSTKNMRQIGAELKAGYILEGGVQARGQRVRVNAQLIETATDRHLWADTYDHELTAANLFDIQAELARGIATELQLTLSDPDRQIIDQIPTQNIEAYNAYLRGLELRDRGGHTAENTPLLVQAYEQAVALDADFALAWAQLSIARSMHFQYTRKEQTLQAALSARDRAYALKPNLPQVELARIVFLYRVENQYQQALDGLQAMDRLDAASLMLKSYLLRRVGKFDQAYQTALAAQQLDPRSVATASHLVNMSWEADKCEAAGRHAREALALAPDSMDVRYNSATYEIECNGDLDRADELIQNQGISDPWHMNVARSILEAKHDYPRLLELSKTQGLDWFPKGKELLRVRALRGLGNEAGANALLDDIFSGLEALEDHTAPEQLQAWSQLAQAKVLAYALLGDAEQTNSWIREHKQRFDLSTKGDQYHSQGNRFFYANMYAMVGLKENALAGLQAMLELPGGSRFPAIELAPAFDGLRDHPTYIALRNKHAVAQPAR